MMYQIDEETFNEFALAQEMITTLYDLTVNTRDREVSLDSNALAGTLSVIKRQLDNVSKTMSNSHSN